MHPPTYNTDYHVTIHNAAATLDTLYKSGGNAANGDYLCDSWYGTLEEAKIRCNADPNCVALHDFNNDGNNWRFCSSVTYQVDGPASTMLKVGPVSLVSLGKDGCDSSQKCDACYGDCDDDNDCKGSLKCFERDGDTKIPGCAGGGVNNYDYCYVVESPTVESPTAAGTGVLILPGKVYKAVGPSGVVQQSGEEPLMMDPPYEYHRAYNLAGGYACYSNNAMGVSHCRGRLSDDSQGWSVNSNVAEHDYWQIDLSTPQVIVGGRIKCRKGHGQCFRTFKVQVSMNGGVDGTWLKVDDDATFIGNEVRDNDPVDALFSKSYYARYIRYTPVLCHSHCSARFAALVCPNGQLCKPPKETGILLSSEPFILYARACNVLGCSSSSTTNMGVPDPPKNVMMRNHGLKSENLLVLDVMDGYSSSPITEYIVEYLSAKPGLMHVPCDELIGGDTCIETKNSKTEDTCKQNGLNIVIPRSRDHWIYLLEEYKPYLKDIVPGITKDENGGSFTNYAFNSKDLPKNSYHGQFF